MTEQTFNPLQAVLIRERLILFWELRRSAARSYSVRRLIEDIALSDANEGAPHAYDEREDEDGTRFDAGFTLKHSTVDNLLSRKASAISDDNLMLIGNFLSSEGFLSAEALALCGRHPNLKLARQFSGIAPSDARLQRYRRSLEGEYRAAEQAQSLWVAAPGRSKPFVTLRLAGNAGQEAKDGKLFEGRIFLMPTDMTMIVEVSLPDSNVECCLHRIGVDGATMILHHEARPPIALDRLSPQSWRAGERLSYQAATPRQGPISGLRETRHVRQPSPSLSRSPEEQAFDFALLSAATEGDLPALLLALLNGADINTQDPATGATATHIAAERADAEMVRWLADSSFGDIKRLGDLLPQTTLDDRQRARWTKLSYSRDPLILDHQQCLASACAPISTDASERNRIATEIWQFLLRREIEAHAGAFGTNSTALLEIYQPSPPMREAMQRYAPLLPPGFSDPIADDPDEQV